MVVELFSVGEQFSSRLCVKGQTRRKKNETFAFNEIISIFAPLS